MQRKERTFLFPNANQSLAPIGPYRQHTNEQIAAARNFDGLKQALLLASCIGLQYI